MPVLITCSFRRFPVFAGNRRLQPVRRCQVGLPGACGDRERQREQERKRGDL